MKKITIDGNTAAADCTDSAVLRRSERGNGGNGGNCPGEGSVGV